MLEKNNEDAAEETNPEDVAEEPPPAVESPTACSNATADLVERFEEEMLETVSHGEAVLEELKRTFFENDAELHW